MTRGCWQSPARYGRCADAPGPAPGPALLVIVHRDTDQLTVELEDDDAPRLQIPLCALAAYELEQWCWMRPDDDPHHTP